MDFGGKNCLECGSFIKHKIRRDIERKKFCNHSCRGKYAGKRLSKEHLDMMKEKCNTPEVNLKKARKGKDNGRYIEDRSLVKSKRPQFENREWKLKVFERDNYTCQICNQRGGKLQADHIKPYSLYPDCRWDLDNGRTLCIECHKKTDTYGGKMKKILNNLKGNDNAV